jgi:putative ABC transport system ATP-binding protein/lipoprotein-releasing system ATP-binding protein
LSHLECDGQTEIAGEEGSVYGAHRTMTQPTSQISARDLYRSFKMGDRTIEVLRGISMDIATGESLFLVGASGAGKSTLLYTLAGLERPERGTVQFDGADVYSQSERNLARLRNTKFGFIFQAYHLLPELTAIENVMLPALIGGASKDAAAEAALERVGLKERLQHLPAELSGGEQQRVAIARALINNPEVIFADEPTGNLDSNTGRSIMELLLNLVSEQRKTLVVVTHDASLARRGARQLEIRDGLIV